MRGRREPQVSMLTFIDLETRVPADHPLRTINRLADRALAQLSPEFDRMYAQVGRPSIPPERLLKASLLISLYSVRSERGFCEQLDYNLLPCGPATIKSGWLTGSNPWPSFRLSSTACTLRWAGLPFLLSGS